MNVSFVQNSHHGGPGLLGDYLRERGWSIQPLVTYEQVVDTTFESVEADLVVILGSPRGVYEDSEAWICREHAMVEHLLQRDVPILGICFGAQLLAKVLGGSVRPMAHSYRDWLENDDVPSNIWRGPWLRWHGDRIFPSAKVDLIASHSGIIQAFRQGRNFGLQFHPEATIAMLGGWIDALPDDRRDRARAGALAYYATNETAIRQRSYALFDAILEEQGLGQSCGRDGKRVADG